jgi:zinc protease
LTVDRRCKAWVCILRGAPAVLALALAPVLPLVYGGTIRPQSARSAATVKGKAPVNPEVLKVKLPKPVEASLKNGLRLIVLEDHKVPTFTMELVIRTGGLSDPADHHGLAGFTASLLRAGTTKRSARQIDEELDSIGAALFAGSTTSIGTSNITAAGLTESLDTLLDIVADLVINPTFPAEEVEGFKTRSLSQYQLNRSDPTFLSLERLTRALYGSHPAGFLIAPVDSVNSMAHASLARFHSTYYRANNAMLAIAGDVTMAALLPRIGESFGAWKAGNLPSGAIPEAPEPGPLRVSLVDRPGSVQTALHLGVPAIRRTDPDYFPMVVMDRIVGGSPIARLFTTLREEKGYAYSPYSSLVASEFRGYWQASCQVRTEVTGPALEELLKELHRIAEEPVSQRELADAKRGLIGTFAISVERPRIMLQNIITQNIYHLPAGYWDAYPRRIDEVTAGAVQRVARKYLDLSHLQLVAVGDAAKIGDTLAKYGPVEVYGVDGNLIKSAQGK